MSSTFGTFELAGRALRASQGVIGVIGHNLANVNSPGYSRQQAHLAASPPYTLSSFFYRAPGQIGTGVDLVAITRIRDAFLDDRLQQAGSYQAEYQSLRDILTRAQTAYNEPGNSGLNSQLTAFFNSFQELSRNPESGGIRATVRQQAVTLSKRFNQVHAVLNQIELDIQNLVNARLDEANSLAQQIGKLNKEIRASRAIGDNPNDLSDRRDELVRQLSAIVDLKVLEPLDGKGVQTGEINLSVGGYALVLGDFVQSLPTRFTSVGGQPQLLGQGDPIPVQSGSVGGLIKANDLIGEYRSRLNEIASALIERVNAQHRTGYGLDGGTGRPFFAGTDASNITLDAAILGDLDAIAASGPTANPPALGNGENARAIAQLRSVQIFGPMTLLDYYGVSIAKIGTDVRAYENQSENQTFIMQQMKNLRNSISGVSLDEEMTLMLQYQRSYQAAARYLNTIDSMLDQLINQLGR
jgi:flagellar hook-associated protein 1 FlgK